MPVLERNDTATDEAIARSEPPFASAEDLLAPATAVGQTGELPDPTLTARIAGQADRVREIAPERV